jgi:hypothetical protein
VRRSMAWSPRTITRAFRAFNHGGGPGDAPSCSRPPPHVSSTVTEKVKQDLGLERHAGFGNRGGALKLPPSGGSIQEEPLGDQGRIRGGDTLPRTERAAREVLSLPIYPELSDEDVRTVISAVRSF